MNTKKFSKIFQSLLGAGVSVNDATKSAAKLASKVEKVPEPKVSGKPGNKGKLSVREQIMQYATSRRGNVWTLQALALALPKVNIGNLSVNITPLTKSGKIVRVGRGEYRKAH
jgi:hypothetical protein